MDHVSRVKAHVPEPDLVDRHVTIDQRLEEPGVMWAPYISSTQEHVLRGGLGDPIRVRIRLGWISE